MGFQLKNKRRREIELREKGGIPTTPIIEGAEFEQYDIRDDWKCVIIKCIPSSSVVETSEPLTKLQAALHVNLIMNPSRW